MRWDDDIMIFGQGTVTELEKVKELLDLGGYGVTNVCTFNLALVAKRPLGKVMPAK